MREEDEAVAGLTWNLERCGAVIAVGDFDAAAIQKEIATRFGDLEPDSSRRSADRPEPDSRTGFGHRRDPGLDLEPRTFAEQHAPAVARAQLPPA